MKTRLGATYWQMSQSMRMRPSHDHIDEVNDEVFAAAVVVAATVDAEAEAEVPRRAMIVASF